MRLSTILFHALFVVVFLNASGFTQSPSGFVTGQITERSTGQSIAGARVLIKGAGNLLAETGTGSDGKFVIEVKGGVYDIEIRRSDFAPITRNRVEVVGGRYTVLNAQLEVTRTENVEVRSDIFSENAEQPVSGVTLGREDIRNTPGTAGDPLRAINSQPAVSAASGEFADLIVRGGTADENLTFIDRIPVGDFTYFTDKYDGNRGGRAAILAPDIFDRAEFSAGGFGVRYGDKLSSALDITLREANRRRVQGVIFADSGTAGGSLDVPLGAHGSWLFSARRSYIDVALDVAGIADQGLIGYPRTFDVTNKFVYDVAAGHKLSLTALNFFETFDQTDEQSSNIGRRTDRFRLQRTSQRHIFGATLSSTIGSKTLAQTTAWATVSHNDGTFYIPFSNTLQRSRDLRDSQAGIKEDVSHVPSTKLQIAAGGGLYFDQANYHTFENAGRFYSPLEEEYNAAARANRLDLGTTASGYAYVQALWQATRRLSITPGVRLDHYGLTGETLASPRVAAKVVIATRVSATFAAGIYRQPPGIFVLSLTPANRDLKSQTAAHFIGGVEWLVREDIRVRFEAYQKSYEGLIVQRIRATPGFVSDGNYANSGNGSSRGLEISVHKALSGFFSGQASYAYVRSRRSFVENGVEVPSDFERPHQLTLIGITRFYGVAIAAKYKVASGLPFSRRTPFRPSPPFGVFVQRIASDSDINALRLPNFASLDLRAEKRFGFKRWSFAPYIDIFNITNYNSIVQPDYEFFRSSPQMLRENKRLPIFGLRLEF